MTLRKHREEGIELALELLVEADVGGVLRELRVVGVAEARGARHRTRRPFVCGGVCVRRGGLRLDGAWIATLG